MDIGLLFWIIMILLIIGQVGVGWGGWGGARGPFLTGFIIILLFFLLGWHDFGFIIRNGGVH
jgi:hypothetical protein